MTAVGWVARSGMAPALLSAGVGREMDPGLRRDDSGGWGGSVRHGTGPDRGIRTCISSIPAAIPAR